jgi:hypothetical protein
MTKTAAERLQNNALGLLPGPLSRLEYMADLRESGTQYFHWGLARMYGEHGLQQSLAEVHSAVLLDVLRTPLPALAHEVHNIADKNFLVPDAYVRSLSKKLNLLLPARRFDGWERQLKMVLFVLSCLALRLAVPVRPVAC